ncbi:uncharacterized protein BO80DRAFT_390633 [Aspergillus ibericus CBS 121593]|uniref:Uncharacterized protein n=1 Tax=Aspergillus ibericus CBS 121593 TaxID=1448316 RepID=A0A395GN41_9EURO|nr:hypothetical protein BO80DRAFT_390633 [Aspergillus ibericus CBS 121593]RAK96930.1 hypothetical protein BO80DRAFT_390633 [Aspergillus ibericus CBS 121593]
MAPSFPPDTAGPDAARAYITRTLIRKYDATPELAEKLATCWQLGRVSELRAASLKHLQGDFGNDAGLCLHRAIREDIIGDWQETPTAAFTIWLASTATVIHTIVLVLFFLPELRFQSPCQRILLARSPASWLFFAAGMLNYAYQRLYHEDAISVPVAAAAGAISLAVGVSMFW